MAKSFEVKVVAPDGATWSGAAVSLVAPSEFGYLGILADHAPLAVNLGRGKIIIRDGSGKVSEFRAEGKGFLSVFKNKASVILGVIVIAFFVSLPAAAVFAEEIIPDPILFQALPDNGRDILKVVPFPGSLSADILPSCDSTMDFAMLSPSPNPSPFGLALSTR